MADKSFVVKNGLVTGSNVTSLGTAVTITATGNVGITNSAPTHDLSVNGDVYLGNTTVAGFANATTSVSVGTTFIANTTGAYHTGTMNAASLTVGSSTIANSTGVYTGVVNGSSLTISSYGSTTGGAVVNSSIIAVGNSTVNVSVNTSVITIRGNVVANSTGANNAFNLGGVSSSGYALLSGANFTGNVAIGGNLVVTGTTMYANVTNLDVADKNITIAKGAVSAATDGAGLTVDTVNIGWYYHLASNTWQSNVGITASANNLAIGNTTNRWNVYANNLVGNGASVTSVDAATLGGNTAATIYSTFTQNTTFTSTIALYQSTAGLAGNVALLTSNNSNYLGGTAAASYQTIAGLNANVAALGYLTSTGTANNANYLGGTAAASYQTIAGLNANVAALGYLTSTGTANNANYLGGSAAATYAKLAGPSFTGNSIFATYHSVDTNGGVFRSGSGNYGVRIYPGGGTDTTLSVLQFTTANQSTQIGSVFANSTIMGIGGDTVSTTIRGGGTVVSTFTTSGEQVTSLGVGTAPSGTAGEIRANNNITAYYTSDATFKENVKPIENALEKVMMVDGVEFDWTDEFIKDHGGEDGYFVRRHDVGVIAQNIEKVLPEVVATRPDGTKAVKYDRIVALLIEAIKDQQVQIDELKRGK